MSDFTIVDFYGPQNKSQCGYCKQETTCHSHGMMAHRLTASDYQSLMDRGWRRCGSYCYKPNMPITCCPAYTIKCDATLFKPSKSQKKVIKRFNKFLTDGIHDKQSTNQRENDSKTEPMVTTECNESSFQPDSIPAHDRVDLDKVKQSLMKGISGSIEQPSTTTKSVAKVQSENVSATQTNNIQGADPSKPLRKKAKLLRLERKAAKRELQIVDETDSNVQQSKPLKNQEKSLEQLLNEIPENARHKLKVKLICCDDVSVAEELNVYKSYQVIIHHDPPSKITANSLERFLINSPLKVKCMRVNDEDFIKTLKIEYLIYDKYQTTIHNDPPKSINDFVDFLVESPLVDVENVMDDDGPTTGYGSFHQQYWIDDRLIGVGVIDILPNSVSSVYFFYDPEYNFLSLGTYAALREIYLVQELNRSAVNLHNYYMGFYIHSCTKMRYKAKMQPSHLLCPETYTWHLINDSLTKKLDEAKYQRLNLDATFKDCDEFTDDDLKGTLVLKDYSKYSKLSQLRVPPSQSTLNNIRLYGKLVGKSLAQKMLYCC